MLGRQRRLCDVLSTGERRRRAILVVGAAVAAFAFSGCGDRGDRDGSQAVVAQPVVPRETEAEPTPGSADGLRRAEPLVTEEEATPQASSSVGRAARGRVFSSDDRASFRRLERSLGGRYGVALAGSAASEVAQVGSLRTGVAWSTSKVPIAMAVIAAGAGQVQKQNLAAAITLSDNSAADSLWKALGDGQTAAQAADAQLRAAGDTSTMIESRQLLPGFSSFGQTQWSLRNQAIFTAGMACTTAGTEVLALMGRVDTSQRWGLGAADVAAEFKGGWGPGVDPGVGRAISTGKWGR